MSINIKHDIMCLFMLADHVLHRIKTMRLRNLKEMSVRVETTILTIHGAPGSGKSSITDLVLGNPPAKERHSTLVATSPARSMAGCRIAATEHVNWERVGAQELMKLLADSIAYLDEHPQEQLTNKIDNASTSSVTFSLFDYIKTASLATNVM